jgi:hypothetical protein
MFFLAGSMLLTIMFAVGLLLYHRKQDLNMGVRAVAQDVLLLIFLVWLASLSILAYIAFAFGKR